MNLAEYHDYCAPLFDEQDRLADRTREIARLIDEATYATAVDGRESVKDMASVWDVVPSAIYLRIQRHRKLLNDRERGKASSGKSVGLEQSR